MAEDSAREQSALTPSTGSDCESNERLKVKTSNKEHCIGACVCVGGGLYY